MNKKTGFEHVQEFHEAFSHPVNTELTEPETRIVKLRLALILEEFIELSEATLKNQNESVQAFLQNLNDAFEQLHKFEDEDIDLDLVEIADALTDINYVVYGAGHCFGINLDDTMQEVQKSNMSKLGEDGEPIYNDAGKIMKGPNYFKPNIKKVLGLE